jgi:hypothetical protein
MKTLATLLFSCLLGHSSIAQRETYIGLEFGPTIDLYDHIDNGNGLYTKPFVSVPIIGLIAGQEINETFAFETGFYINSYGERFLIKGAYGLGFSTAITAYQIPLRLKARFDLIKDRLSVTTTVGYTIAINNDYASYASGSGFEQSAISGEAYNDSTRTQWSSRYNFRKTYGLIETGISLDYRTQKDVTLYLAANHLAGLTRIVEVDVEYRINDGPIQNGKVFSNGSYYSIVFGVKYPISKWWTQALQE